jgi:hypothetical protein
LLTARKTVGRDKLHMTRIENGVGAGQPDVEGQWLKLGQFWIELKTSKRPVFKTSKVTGYDLKTSQVAWHRHRWLVGGSTTMLMQVGSGAAASRYLVPGNMLSGIVVNGVTELELARISICEPDDQADEIIRKALLANR